MARFSAHRSSLLGLVTAIAVLALALWAAVSVSGLIIGSARPPLSASNLADLDKSGLPVIAQSGQSMLFERITVCYPTESIHPHWDRSLRFPHRDQRLITAVDDATAGGACMSVRMVVFGWPMRGGVWWSVCSASGCETRSGFTFLGPGAVVNLVVTSAASVFVVTLFLWLWREFQVRRIRDGRCWRCGYRLVAPMADARGASELRAAFDHDAACPECGALGPGRRRK